MHTPPIAMAIPKTAKREGLKLKRKDERNTEKIGVVLTRTVAFKIVVSFTADTNKMKCRPRKNPNNTSLFKFFQAWPKPRVILKAKIIKDKAAQAIIKRQKAIEKTSNVGKYLINMEAVPKRIPAAMPSNSVNFLVLTRVKSASPSSRFI